MRAAFLVAAWLLRYRLRGPRAPNSTSRGLQPKKGARIQSERIDGRRVQSARGGQGMTDEIHFSVVTVLVIAAVGAAAIAGPYVERVLGWERILESVESPSSSALLPR